MSDRLILDRRRLLRVGGVGASALLIGSRPAAAAPPLPGPSRVDTGHVEDGRVVFDPWRGASEAPDAPTPSPLPPAERVGFAIVGLGRLSLDEILPAFGASMKAKPVALVSGSPDKMRTVAAQYGIPAGSCYDYEGFDRIAANPAIKVVYVVLPNGLHRAFTERAARAGKHVLCEKPMATNSADARAMVAACEAAGRKLMIAYRIQYEPHNMRAMRFVRERTFGRLVGMTATNVQTVAPDGAEQWRHKRALSGGGALPDIGLYCLNTARFLCGEEPAEVWATLYSPPGDPRFADVEETVAFTLRFPSNFIAQCFTSYGARDDKHQRLNFEAGTIDMPNAYLYQGQKLVVTRREGEVTGNVDLVIPPKNQFAAEMDHMAECVLAGHRPRTPGEEGVQDQVLMEAIYESARTGQPVKLPRVEGLDAFRGSMPAGG